MDHPPTGFSFAVSLSHYTQSIILQLLRTRCLANGSIITQTQRTSPTVHALTPPPPSERFFTDRAHAFGTRLRGLPARLLPCSSLQYSPPSLHPSHHLQPFLRARGEDAGACGSCCYCSPTDSAPSLASAKVVRFLLCGFRLAPCGTPGGS